MIMVAIAHGHWLEGALYLAPVVILVVVLFVQGRGTPTTRTDPRSASERGERHLPAPSATSPR